MNRLVAILVVGLLALACSRHSARVEGSIEGGGGRQLVLEKVGVGKIIRVDSAKLNAAGKFSFRLKNVEPADFYQLTLDTLGSLMLLPCEGERLHLEAQASDLVASSKVQGSEDTELLVQLQQSLALANLAVDSLMQQQAQGEAAVEQRRALARLFVKQKQYNTKFIIQHPQSPASIMAYYQKLGKQLPLFGRADDRFMLRMLSDSLRLRFPKSAYVKSLQVELEALEKEAKRIEMQNLLANAKAVDKPEVELPDTNGKLRRLSDLKGKVVLLDFWASTSSLSLMDNRELIPIYKEYHKGGFEIFQVSIDADSAQWLRSVAQQGLPWISVYCNTQQGCATPLTYGVQKLPANFLVNRRGELVARDVYGEDLKKKVKEFLNK